MKLYYSPGACSLSSHIAMHEAGLTFEALAAPTKTHQLADGTDYYTINPLGYVPYLTLDNGQSLHEGPAIMQYIADQAPAKNLAPANGTYARYKLQEWLNFISTELHKSCSPLFNPATPAETRATFTEKLQSRLKWVNGELADKAYLMGDTFTVADGYLFTVTNWAPRIGVDLAAYPHLVAYRARVAARPGVIAAMKAEGLLG
jgi:glutathione S-transferase